MDTFSDHKDRPVWRKSTGEIYCPGDNCPQDCNDSCPIWLNTNMVQFGMMKDFKNAIEAGELAVKIAPDFADAWNNLATMYGQDGNHRKAYEYYKKALEIRPGYAAAMRGLEMAEKHLASDAGTASTTNFSEVVEIANSMVQYAYMLKLYPQPSLPFVPELMAYIGNASQTILNDLNDLLMTEGSSIFNEPKLALNWGFYAGVAAVTLWDRNWSVLQKKGLMPILYESAGIDNLDERVLNLTYGASTEDEFSEYHKKFGALCMLVMTKFTMEEIRNDVVQAILKMVQVAYLLGCAYRLHEIGMH